MSSPWFDAYAFCSGDARARTLAQQRDRDRLHIIYFAACVQTHTRARISFMDSALHTTHHTTHVRDETACVCARIMGIYRAYVRSIDVDYYKLAGARLCATNVCGNFQQFCLRYLRSHVLAPAQRLGHEPCLPVIHAYAHHMGRPIVMTTQFNKTALFRTTSARP